jgi:putative transposon-encoded protein DUF2080
MFIGSILLITAASSRLASTCGTNANVSTLAANIIPIVNAPSGNSGHVVVPKVWIGKEAIVTLKDKESNSKGKR